MIEISFYNQKMYIDYHNTKQKIDKMYIIIHSLHCVICSSGIQ